MLGICLGLVLMAFTRKIKRSELLCVKHGRKRGRVSRKKENIKHTYIIKAFKDSAGYILIGGCYIFFPKSKIGKRVQFVVRY